MKRFNTLSTLFLFAMAIHAQTQLTIETTAGELKNVLTEEQIQTVTDLTLTGSMNDSDFYTIRDGMPELKILDMRKVEVDSIPVKAFYNSGYKECTLPESLIFVGDSAFSSDFFQTTIDSNNSISLIETIYVTGHFPKLGEFSIDYGTNIIISEDNIYCKQEGKYDNIYSADGKILYYGQNRYSIIEEGTEIIESHAFDRVGLAYISIPSTLKLIKEQAFVKIAPMIPTNPYYDTMVHFVSKAEIPPVLEINAFLSDNLSEFMLLVPDGKADIYRRADAQWSKFESITEISGINNPQKSSYPIYVTKNDEGITVKSEQKLSKVQVCTLSGKCCFSKNVIGTETYIPKLDNNSIFLLKAMFEDNSISYIKFIF